MECSIAKFCLEQVSGQAVIAKQGMISMCLIMKVEAFTFLMTVSAKQSAVQIEKHMLRTPDCIDDVPETFINGIKLKQRIFIHTVKKS